DERLAVNGIADRAEHIVDRAVWYCKDDDAAPFGCLTHELRLLASRPHFIACSLQPFPQRAARAPLANNCNPRFHDAPPLMDAALVRCESRPSASDLLDRTGAYLCRTT